MWATKLRAFEQMLNPKKENTKKEKKEHTNPTRGYLCA